jgi:hypothetical protein
MAMKIKKSVLIVTFAVSTESTFRLTTVHVAREQYLNIRAGQYLTP